MNATMSTNIVLLPPPRKGKVREVYDVDSERCLIVATDRISAFDVVMATGIPDKGRILNQLSAFWFDFLSDVCPNHMISANDNEIRNALEQRSGRTFDLADLGIEGRAMLAKKARPLAIECVARGYITGSLFKEYLAFGPNVHGLGLPEGLVESDRLPIPIFTPATKAEQGHDENLSEKEAERLVGREVYEKARTWTLELFSRASAHAEACGIILADTKFEFGLCDGQLIWIDEALTPDSSRFWPKESYSPGRAQPSYDKQYVRDYLESIGWNKQPPGPALPDEVVSRTREKYLQAFHAITGRDLDS